MQYIVIFEVVVYFVNIASKSVLLLAVRFSST